MIVVRVIPWVGVVVVMVRGGAGVGVGSEAWAWAWFSGRTGGLFGAILYY